MTLIRTFITCACLYLCLCLIFCDTKQQIAAEDSQCVETWLDTLLTLKCTIVAANGTYFVPAFPSIILNDGNNLRPNDLNYENIKFHAVFLRKDGNEFSEHSILIIGDNPSDEDLQNNKIDICDMSFFRNGTALDFCLRDVLRYANESITVVSTPDTTPPTETPTTCPIPTPATSTCPPIPTPPNNSSRAVTPLKLFIALGFFSLLIKLIRIL